MPVSTQYAPGRKKYRGKYENILIKEFESLLPSKAPWQK